MTTTTTNLKKLPSKSVANKHQLASMISDALNWYEPRFQSSLMHRDEDELSLIVNTLLLKTMKQIVGDLRAYELPAHKLPLSVERNPFAQLTDATIIQTLVWTFAHSEKIGRLSSVVREYFGLKPRMNDDYRVFEAHIDITSVTPELLNELVSLGFEPDGAYINAPPCYEAGLTLAFTPNVAQRERFRTLRQLVLEQSTKAAAMIQDTSGITGFIEVETYSSALIRKYLPFKPISKFEGAKFPFVSGDYTILELPTTEVEANSAGIALDSHKVIDLHVKIPTCVRNREYPDAENPQMLELRKNLLTMGLHQHITEAGNIIFTGQFLRSAQAMVVFRALDKYATQFGGILEMCVEPCIMFWRKRSTGANGEQLRAIVPRVLLPAGSANANPNL